MSGGSYNYLYHRIEDMADSMELIHRTDQNDLDAGRLEAEVYDRTKRAYIRGEEAVAVLRSVASEREWFIGLLRMVAKAAHDIEWVDSSDYRPGDEVAAIRACRAYIGEDAK